MDGEVLKNKNECTRWFFVDVPDQRKQTMEVKMLARQAKRAASGMKTLHVLE